jgi:hypothetical protein
MRKAYPNPFVPEPDYNVGQYRDALTYELKGSSFQLIMDNGKTYAVHFIAEDMLVFGERGKPMCWERYEALKLDDQTYLVEAAIENASPRTSYTIVLDLMQYLVTVVRTQIGANKLLPNTAKQEVFFGAINRPGEKLATIRHGFTADLVGYKILWHYSPNFDAIHSFTSEHYIRFPRGEKPELPVDPTEEEIAERDWIYEKRGSGCFEAPAFYVKIREDIYLYGFTEENDSRRDAGRPGNGLIVLVNANSVHDIGSCIGSTVKNGCLVPFHRTFSAFGGFLAQEDPVDKQASPYRID